MERIYIAGSLFNEAEVNQRKLEEEKLRELGYTDIYNPINAPCNDKAKLPTAQDIFGQDITEVLNSDIVVADISNPSDPGVYAELGAIWVCNYLGYLIQAGFTVDQISEHLKPKKVVTHLSDIRKATSGAYDGNHIPVGFNQFIIGMVEDMGVIKDNFNEVLEELK